MATTGAERYKKLAEAGRRRGAGGISAADLAKLLSIWVPKRSDTWLPDPRDVFIAQEAALANATRQRSFLLSGNGFGYGFNPDSGKTERMEPWAALQSYWRPRPGEHRLLVSLDLSEAELFEEFRTARQRAGLDRVAANPGKRRQLPRHLVSAAPFMILHHHLLAGWPWEKCGRLFLVAPLFAAGHAESAPKGPTSMARRLARGAERFIRSHVLTS